MEEGKGRGRGITFRGRKGVKKEWTPYWGGFYDATSGMTSPEQRNVEERAGYQKNWRAKA